MSKVRRMVFVILLVIVMLVTVAAVCNETCTVVGTYRRDDGKTVIIKQCCNPDGVCTRHEELATR